MPDFGGGTVTLLPSPTIGLSALPSLTTLEELCLNFDDSLARLYIGDRCGAYGAPSPSCNVNYKIYQREGWIQALLDAQIRIERDIGRPLCPSEICEETHPWLDEIVVYHKPIAYLGKKVWSDWVEGELIEDEETGQWCLDVCSADLPEDFTPELIQFSYPNDILACYHGLQSLQIPSCANTITGACGMGLEDGYRFCWNKCQLIRPDADSADPGSTKVEEIAKFMTSVKWRTYTIDSTEAIELVGECGCECCSAITPTLTIVDAQEGIVCINGGCSCKRGRRVKLNYATSMDCYGRNDDLLRAVALLALSMAGHTPAKPCNCDNTFIEHLLQIDPTATTDFAHKIRYGPTFAQMEVMRIMDGYVKRPKLNRNVETGGLLRASRRRTGALRW